tara:strand:+ start:1051 stop:1158 length:108 start_codon:yes stop_codon:yes gene_type:complete
MIGIPTAKRNHKFDGAKNVIKYNLQKTLRYLKNWG